jgi:hypothetical protein
LVITQMIQVELLTAAEKGSAPKSTSKVSVMMPANHKAYVPAATEEHEHNELPEPPVNRPVAETSKPPVEAPPPAPVAPLPVVENAPVSQPVLKKESLWSMDPLQEVPTLAQQQHGKEINDAMAGKDNSLNTKLKAPVVEVGHRLTDSPIRDLKKAIGVNDRYLFISELFRGDEVMYERSIKTINGFRIFAEAEYWIERELKVKLGWEEDKPSTRHFYQLVKRRFS